MRFWTVFNNPVERKAGDVGLQFETKFAITFQMLVNLSQCGYSAIQRINWAQSFHDDDNIKKKKMNNKAVRLLVSFILLLTTCEPYLKCNYQASLTGNRILALYLCFRSYGLLGWGGGHVCLSVCNISLVLFHMVLKKKKKKEKSKLVLRYPQSAEGILQWCCSVNQRLKKDSVLTVVTATGKCYLGFMQCVWKNLRLDYLREASVWIAASCQWSGKL